jgi:tRNA(Ile)-lysidine synthase
VIATFQQYIEQHKLCTKRHRLLLAVSGGVDSIVMLDLFKKSGYHFALVHCNFKLRAEESDGDEQFVRGLGKKYDVPVFTKRFDTKHYAQKNKLSIQMAARDLRYAWFEQLMDEEGFEYTATAQHADDQVETFFINLLRGSGLTGLRGMPYKRDRIIRPLLFAKREEIITYVNENGLLFREDSSNKEDTYLRNKIRLKLLPELTKIDENVTGAILASMDYLNEADIVLQHAINQKSNAIFKEDDGYVRVSKDDIAKLQPVEVWTYYLLREFGFNRDTTNNIADAIFETQSGKTYCSETHEAVIDRQEVLIRPIEKKTEEIYFIKDDHERITKPLSLKFENIPNSVAFKIRTDVRVAQLDKDKLNFPLVLRRWQQGDRFNPIGMKGSKLLSDYFIDQKISRFGKEVVWLLLSGNDIVWVIGHRISDSFKITPETKNILLIEKV